MSCTWVKWGELMRGDLRASFTNWVRSNLTVEWMGPDLGAEPELESDLQFGQVTVRGRCVFHRSRRSAAFVNRKCVVPGHVLVIPLRPALRLVDLTADEVADLFQTAQHVQRGTGTGWNSTSLGVSDFFFELSTYYVLVCTRVPLVKSKVSKVSS